VGDEAVAAAEDAVEDELEEAGADPRGGIEGAEERDDGGGGREEAQDGVGDGFVPGVGRALG